MSRILCSFIFLTITTTGLSQTLTNRDALIVFTRAEVDAQFPEGDSAWIKFLQKNLDIHIVIKIKPR